MLAAQPTAYDYIQQASQTGLAWYQILTGRTTTPAVLPGGAPTAQVSARLSTPLLVVLGLVAIALVVVFLMKK
jgi:hypothetical protein